MNLELIIWILNHWNSPWSLAPSCLLSILSSICVQLNHSMFRLMCINIFHFAISCCFLLLCVYEIYFRDHWLKWKYSFFFSLPSYLYFSISMSHIGVALKKYLDSYEHPWDILQYFANIFLRTIYWIKGKHMLKFVKNVTNKIFYDWKSILN